MRLGRSFPIWLSLLLVGAFAVPSAAVVHPDKTLVTPVAAPWVVSLWLVDDYLDRGTLSTSFFCTGSIIGEHTVITAAHCMSAVAGKSFVIVQGQANNASRGRVLMPRDIVTHPGYDPYKLVNDIALIDTYDEMVGAKVLNLPNYTQAKAALAAGPTIYGWGKNQSGALPKYLRMAKLKNLTGKVPAKFTDFDSTIELAAGRRNANGTYTGACSGDSGGPLVGTAGGKRYLLGITSYGAVKGCLTGDPTIFTRVSAFSSWVKYRLIDFATSRITNEIDVSRAHVWSTPTNPLPTSTGVSDDSVAYARTDATFTTEAIDLPEGDLAGMSVFNYAGGQPQGDVEVRVTPKELWSGDGCNWMSLGGSRPSISLSIGNATTGRTLNQSTYAAGGCPSSLQSVSTTWVHATSNIGCQVKFIANSDGTSSFWLKRQCLPIPSTTAFRVILNSAAASDVEPGLDSWAGAFNLTAPLS